MTKCKDCKYYAPQNHGIGTCFFNPPVVVDKKVANGMNSEHADTYEHKTCGMWEEREDKEMSEKRELTIETMLAAIELTKAKNTIKEGIEIIVYSESYGKRTLKMGVKGLLLKEKGHE